MSKNDTPSIFGNKSRGVVFGAETTSPLYCPPCYLFYFFFFARCILAVKMVGRPSTHWDSVPQREGCAGPLFPDSGEHLCLASPSGCPHEEKRAMEAKQARLGKSRAILTLNWCSVRSLGG